MFAAGYWFFCRFMTQFLEHPNARHLASHSQNNALFMRLDSFLERCHDILDLTQTIVQFSKLAKIEVGGTKGNTLTASVKQVRISCYTRKDNLSVFKGPYIYTDFVGYQVMLSLSAFVTQVRRPCTGGKSHYL